MVKNPPAMWETWVRSLGWEDPLEKGKATQLQYSGLENSMDCIVHGVAKSWPRLRTFTPLPFWAPGAGCLPPYTLTLAPHCASLTLAFLPDFPFPGISLQTYVKQSEGRPEIYFNRLCIFLSHHRKEIGGKKKQTNPKHSDTWKVDAPFASPGPLPGSLLLFPVWFLSVMVNDPSLSPIFL